MPDSSGESSLKIGGIALATSLSASFNLFLLYFYLRRRIGSLGENELWQGLKRSLVAGALMGVILWWWRQIPFFSRGLGELLILICLSALSYFVAAAILRIPEAEALWKWIFKRK